MQSGGPPATSAPPGPGTTTIPTATNAPPKPGAVRTTPQTSYHVPSHVPRGAAAVANIAMPRSGSLATPIVRAGSLVSIRSSGRAPSPAPQQPRTRPATGATLPVARPATPQRADTPRPAQLHAPEKLVFKGAVSLSQVPTRPTPLTSTTPRLATSQPPPIQSTVQLVTQATTQTATMPSSQTGTQATLQLVTQPTVIPITPLVSQPNTQPSPQPTIVTSSSAMSGRPRPVSQATQAGTPTPLTASAPAVVLATPARLTSPGLLGVTTGPARLAVATTLPASNARLVGPPARLPQGRTVTYTSSHQVLQATRLPTAPVRLGPAGRGVVSLHMGVAPLKPAPTIQPTAQASATQPSGQPTSQPNTQPTGQTSSQPSSQPGTLPTLQPAPLRAIPTQTKVMTSSVVTVAAVAGGPLRSVVAAVPPGSTPAPSLAPAPALSPASVAASAPVSKTASAYAQTLTTVAARPVAVATQPARPGQGQPSVYIQTGHRASPGTTYYYEAPSGYQVAGRPYSGTTPYIVQTTPARAVGTTTQQVQGIVANTVPTCVASAVASTIVSTASNGAASTIAGSVVSGVTGVVSGVTGGVVSSVVSNMASGQPVRFNSVMVVDPNRTALPIHAAYVPAEGGTGTAFIAADSSLLTAQNPSQTLPVSAPASVQAPSQPQSSSIITQSTSLPSTQAIQQEVSQPLQATTQATALATQLTSSPSQASVQIHMVPTPTPIHIQMHTQAHVPVSVQPQLSQTQPSVVQTTQGSLQTPPQAPTGGVVQTQIQFQSQPQPQSQSQSQPPTQGSPLPATKQNASPRPSILRKRDIEGSPMKAQKNLTPMLASMGISASNSNMVSGLPNLVAPSSPPSPPKRPDSGGPQSSGSTTISATSSPGQESPPPNPQPPPSAASITAGLHAAGLHSGPQGPEMSPRKKPRKQQLTGNELQEHKISDDEMEFLTEEKDEDFHQQQQQITPGMQQPTQPLMPQPQQSLQAPQQQGALQQQQPQQQQAAATTLREYYPKRPNVSLLSTYRYSWKSRHNHFLRHSDVRPKDERRPTVGELASQRHIIQRLNGWKVHHLTTQMEDLADVESQVYQQLDTMLDVMERKAEQDQDKDVNRVNELIKGNMQRSRVIADQLLEAKATVMKIFEHKTHVAEIINRSSGKRTFKKRDKS